MKLKGFDSVISQQTLDLWITKLNWRSRLPHKNKRYRKPISLQHVNKLISKHKDINKRFTMIDQDSKLRHWEGDTVYGKDSYFVNLAERFSKIFLSTSVLKKYQRFAATLIP